MSRHHRHHRRDPAARSAVGRSAVGRLAAIGLGTAVAASMLTATARADQPGAATPSGSAHTAVPASFHAQSMSWPTARHGVLMGSASCGEHQCTDVLATSTAGARWHRAGTIPTRISGPGTHGVNEIRFADRHVGWAFGPDLYLTRDGGHTWRQRAVPGDGQQVLALDAGRRATYAITSTCAPGTGLCNDQPLTLWRTQGRHSAHWTKLDVALPANIGADVAVSGSTVYVVDPLRPAAPDRFYAATDGRHFSARPVPCPDAADTALVDVTAVSPRRVAMLCVGDPGMGNSTKTVFTSADTGRTATSAGQPDRAGIRSNLAASRGGDLVVSSVGGNPGSSYVYARPAAASAWTTPVAEQGDGGLGWNDVTFSSRHTGWVVYGPVDWGGPGQLWTTHDGGASWQPVTLRG